MPRFWFVLCMLAWGAAWGGTMLPLTTPVATNIPDIARCTAQGDFRLKTPASDDTFTVTYAVAVPAAGRYALVLEGPGPGVFTRSRYDYRIDDGPWQPARCTRVVTPASAGLAVHRQPACKLDAGEHRVTFRFTPAGQLHAQNRVDQIYLGHAVQISKAYFEPDAPLPPAPKAAPRGLRWRHGDRVVLLGDSITEEGFYARHLARVVNAVCPGESITLYNAGVTLNRTWEALDRLENDVLALKPTWVVVALGVNDCMHMAPEEFSATYRKIVARLRKARVQVLCITPSGMCDAPLFDGRYFHTPDRAQGFDATVQQEAHEIVAIAKRHHALVADVYGALTHHPTPRAALMANQWHPNDAGGRVMALAMLKAAGLTEADAARTGDPRDLTDLRAVPAMGTYPAPGAKAFVGKLPDAVVAVAAFAQNAVYLLDGKKPVACIPVSHHPMGLAYDAASKRLYVTSEGNGRIDVISLPSCKVVDTISLGEVYPTGIVLDGPRAWVGCFFGSCVLEVDLATKKILRAVKFPGLIESVALSADGNQLLAGSSAGVAVIDTKTAALVATLKLANYPTVVRTADGALEIADPTTGTARRYDPFTRTAGEPYPIPHARPDLPVDFGFVAVECKGIHQR
jgi:lysophospholipase L1-like esterase